MIAAIIGDIVFFFYNSKNLNCNGTLYFLRSVHTFSSVGSQIGVVILVTSKQEMERKSEWFCGVKFFLLFLSRVRKRCLNRSSLSRYWFFVHMRPFHLNFTVFFNFLYRTFF